MVFKFARYGFVLVVITAIGGALFRVATAPDRIRDRRSTAQQSCLSSGGSWVKVDRDEMCLSADPAKRN